MNKSSPVTYHCGEDPEMRQASQRARASFRNFFNCISQDFNRIIPACELSCVKVPFCDDFDDPNFEVEHMWVDEVDFDGVYLTGVLLNSPNQLQSVNEGDPVEFPLDRLDDWLCVMEDQTYGGFTVQLIRSRLDPTDRERHDEAWEFDFPSPEIVNVPDICDEFENTIAELLAKQIAEAPETVDELFDGGRTLLHLASLYGRVASVKVLLGNDANVDARCDRGWTPYQYAKSLDWQTVMQLLQQSS